MAVTLDDAVPGELRKLGIGIFDQLQRRRGRADFGNGRADRGRQADAARDRALGRFIAGRDNVDEIGIDQKRRMFEDGQRHRGLVDGQRLHDGGRCIGAAAKHFGHCLAHQRRRIIEQHQQRAFGGGAVVVGEIRNQPGPRQSSRGLRPLTGGCVPDPTDKLPNDHGLSGLRNVVRHRHSVPLSQKINHDA
jgi:hypothetical protein